MLTHSYHSCSATIILWNPKKLQWNSEILQKWKPHNTCATERVITICLQTNYHGCLAVLDTSWHTMVKCLYTCTYFQASVAYGHYSHVGGFKLDTWLFFHKLWRRPSCNESCTCEYIILRFLLLFFISASYLRRKWVKDSCSDVKLHILSLCASSLNFDVAQW